MLIAIMLVVGGVAVSAALLVGGIGKRANDTSIKSGAVDSNVALRSNIAYCGSNNPLQTLDLYLPQAGSTPYPLVVFVHGGGWRVGDKQNNIVSYYSKSLLDKGIAVASINYRLTPTARYPQQNQDVACALNFLVGHAEQYGYTTSAWGIVGDRAGAQLAAMALTDSTVKAPLKAFVGLYGPYDLSLQLARNPRPDSDARNYLNGADSKLASPLYQTHNLKVRYLLFHGQTDRIVPLKQMERYQKSLESAGASVTAVSVKHAGHYFDASSRPSREAIRTQITEFLQAQLGS